MGTILNITVLLVDPIAALLLLFILFSERNRLFAPMGYRFALSIAVAGLFGQIGWSIMVIFASEIVTSSSMPWWIGKDIGYFLFGVTYLLNQFQHNAVKGHGASGDDF